MMLSHFSEILSHDGGTSTRTLYYLRNIFVGRPKILAQEYFPTEVCIQNKIPKTGEASGEDQ